MVREQTKAGLGQGALLPCSEEPQPRSGCGLSVLVLGSMGCGAHPRITPVCTGSWRGLTEHCLGRAKGFTRGSQPSHARQVCAQLPTAAISPLPREGRSSLNLPILTARPMHISRRQKPRRLHGSHATARLSSRKT